MKNLLLPTIALALISSSCAVDSSSNNPPSKSNLSFDEAVNNYSNELVARANNSISSPSNPEKTTDSPTYVITYVIEKDELKTRKDADINPTSFAINTGITEIWSNLFCTEELKGIMQKYNVFMISGHLIDKEGEKYSMSSCME
jgi:hypothetical protein